MNQDFYVISHTIILGKNVVGLYQRLRLYLEPLGPRSVDVWHGRPTFYCFEIGRVKTVAFKSNVKQ